MVHIEFLKVIWMFTSCLSITVSSQSYDEIKFIGLGDPAPLRHFDETPVCSSYKSLCRISMNITQLVQGYKPVGTIPHERQHCACPNNVSCPTKMAAGDQRSINRVFRSRGQMIHARLDYCNLTLPDRKCERNEPAFTLMGNGPFMLEMYGNFNCYCLRELFAHKSWSDGMFNYIEYSCGKPRCHVIEKRRQNAGSICMTITSKRTKDTNVPYLLHEYKCRCRYYEECVVLGELPGKDHETAHAYCQNLFSRRRIH